MNAEEWLRENERIDNMPPYHRGADAYQYLCEEAANIIRALLAENDAEIERLKKEVSHTKEVEFPRRVEKVTKTLAAKLQAAESLAAARLADQEAIERHVTKRVAREIVDIMNHCETFQDVKAVIWQSYGVE